MDEKTVDRAFRAETVAKVAQAERAVHSLLGAGFTKDQLAVICSDRSREQFLAATGTDPPGAANNVRGADVLKGTSVMINEKRYVLCVGYSNGDILFIRGPDPRLPSITSDVFEAAVFSSPEEALSFRQLLPHQLDGARRYGVHEWKADNYVIPVLQGGGLCQIPQGESGSQLEAAL